MNDVRHADLDALSAYIDGEAPEWADHVEGCPRCRATAAELRALSATVGGPVDSAPAAQREGAIAAALGLAEADAASRIHRQPLPAAHGQPRLAPPSATRATDQARRRWWPQSWAVPVVAAVVLAFMGLAGVILSSTRSTDHTETLAGPAADAKSERAVAGAPQAPVGDLGDLADPATLRARALGVTATASNAASARSSAESGASASNATSAPSTATNTGNTGAAVSSAASSPNAVAPPSAAGGSAAVATGGATGGAGGAASLNVAPNAVGTRPCEERARTREPGLGPVTYFATARRGTTPAYVLGFGSGPNVTLLLLAQDGCGELLRSVGP